jgi:signal transduction histidine kinase
MSVRLKIALTIFITGLITALGVIATVAVAFQRFEHENTFERAGQFLGRVVSLYDNIFDLHERQPDDFAIFLRNLVLLEPDSQLYLLDAEGRVLASTGSVKLAPGFKVSLGPVQQAIAQYRAQRRGEGAPMGRAPYVMGDDPERMDANAVVAAQPLHRLQIRPDGPVAGYLYLVCHKPPLPPGRLAMFRSSLAGPAMAAVAAVVALATLLAAWIVVAVTRPLRALSEEVAAVTRDGLTGPPAADGQGLAARGAAVAGAPLAIGPPPRGRQDEFAQLRQGFHTMLATLRSQWEALRRLDHFRREGVSNLSHDLRSPLTATVACLETLEQRWAALAPPAGPSAEERRLVEVALRNTRNTARLVQSLGELAQLDEPAYALRTEAVDLGELLDDIAMRFAERAGRQGVMLDALHAAPGEDLPPPVASVDVELIERAVANLVDNALKFCPAGAHIHLATQRDPEAPQVLLQVSDTGPGIAAADLPHLFDRFYQARQSVAPATGEGGRGLGLAIVKRIVELHHGHLAVASTPGKGTVVSLRLPV